MARPDLDQPQEINDAPVSQSSFQMFQAVWKHKALLVLGAIIGLVLGGLYYAQRPPVYQAKAQLMIIKKQPPSLPGMQTSAAFMMDDFVTAHAILICSQMIVKQAVADKKLQNLPSFAGQGDVEGIIRSNLTAAPVSTSNSNSPTPILNLSCRSAVPEDASVILDAVIEAYKTFLTEEYRGVTKKTENLLNNAKVALQDAKNTFEKELEQQKQQVLLFNKDNHLAAQDPLTALDLRYSTLDLKLLEFQNLLEIVDEAVTSKANLRNIINADQPVTLPRSQNDDIRGALMSKKLQLEIEVDNQATLVGEDHPSLEALRAQIKTMDKYIKLYPPDSDPVRMLPPPKPETIDAYRERILWEQKKIKREMAALDLKRQDEMKEFTKLSRLLELRESKRRQLVKTEEVLELLKGPIQQMDVLKEFTAYNAKTIAMPAFAGKVEPKPTVVFPLALLGGLLVGAGLAWGAEMSDRSFRSPHEIRRRLGLPILGHVPQFDPAEVAAAEAPGMDLGLCTIHNPKGTESEAYRGVRTALCFSTRGERHQLIQVTSPTQGDGKSTLCANLAISMAQSGKRVLLIDADCRRPRQHRLFNVTNARGLVTVITDQATANEVIQPTPVPNLSVLVCGPRPNNPAELLTSPRFAEVLEELRPSYDFIIVDTPPMLAVSDPSVVAPRVDGVLVTIRLSRNGRPAAERAKEMLMAIGANILGIVVNGLGRKGKDGYYETDSYGYAYEYEYEYAYAYEPDDSDSAVDLDDAKVAEPASAVSNGTGDDGANSAVNLGDNPRGRRRRSSKNGSRGNGRPFGWLRFWG